MRNERKTNFGTKKWRRGGDKPWRRRHNGAHGKPIELCLCSACANSFYLMDDHCIKRVDRNQKYKDNCCMCGVRYGYDYKIYDNSRSMSMAY